MINILIHKYILFYFLFYFFTYPFSPELPFLSFPNWNPVSRGFNLESSTKRDSPGSFVTNLVGLVIVNSTGG